MRAWVTAVLLVLAPVAAGEARQTAPRLRDALVAAVTPALPFPEATDDGTPRGGASDPEWTVRWPVDDRAVVEVVANPLNAENHARALKAESAIQKAAMQSQQRSQADYERALSDFQRTGRISSEIREISLGDDGAAGERFDAESQLTIEASLVNLPHRITLGTARLPEAFRGSDGPAAIVRVSAHEYEERDEQNVPAATHFCAEQVWLLFGPVAAPMVSRTSGHEAAIALSAPATGAAGLVLISVRGNAELVDRVLHRANWSLVSTVQ